MRKPLASKSYSFEAVGTIGEGLTQCGEPVLVGSEGALQQGNGTRDEGWVSLPGREAGAGEPLCQMAQGQAPSANRACPALTEQHQPVAQA